MNYECCNLQWMGHLHYNAGLSSYDAVCTRRKLIPPRPTQQPRKCESSRERPQNIFFFAICMKPASIRQDVLTCISLYSDFPYRRYLGLFEVTIIIITDVNWRGRDKGDSASPSPQHFFLRKKIFLTIEMKGVNTKFAVRVREKGVYIYIKDWSRQIFHLFLPCLLPKLRFDTHGRFPSLFKRYEPSYA